MAASVNSLIQVQDLQKHYNRGTIKALDGVTVNGASVDVTASLNDGEGEGSSAQLASSAPASVKNENGESVSVELTLIGAKSNTAVAKNDSINVASMTGASVNAPGKALKVTSDANALALPVVQIPDTEIGYVAVGLTVIVSKANGQFTAFIDTTDSEITVSSVSVINTYTAKADAKTTQAVGGVTANLLSADVNIADAQVTTQAEAGIRGNGIMTVSGDVTVKVEGVATAYAGLATSAAEIAGVNIAANSVTAEMKAQQCAYIEDASITASRASVISELNKGRTDGAVAELGSVTTGSFSASLIGATTNTAKACADATSHAYIDGASVDVGDGDITVRSDATSNVIADVKLPDGSIGLVSVGLNVMQAEANGNFLAYLNGTTATVIADTLDITSVYTSDAVARTSQSKHGIHASGVNAQVNSADASVGTVAGAGVGLDIGQDEDSGDSDGEGDLRIQVDTISILADGTAKAKAHVAMQSGVAFIDAVANALKATVSAEQKAQLNGAVVDADINDAQSDKTASVSVVSRFNDGSEEGAVAELGSITDKTVSASYYSASVSEARAEMAGKSEASITGASIASDSVSVLNEATSFAKACTKEASASAGYVSIGVTVVDALANGSFNAYIDTTDASVDAGTVDVSNTYTATADSKTAQSVGALTAISGKTNVANAEVGVQAEAGIKGNGSVIADGDVAVKAVGTATAEAGISTATLAITGIDVAANVLTATLEAEQYAYIKDTNVKAANVSVISELNKGRTDGAVAELGSITTGSFSATLVGANANSATATADAVNHAYASGASIDVGNGVLDIIADATSNATADVRLPANVGLASIGVNVMNAYANGNYQAYLNGSSGNVTAGNVNIRNTYKANANAKTAQSVSVNAVSGQTNVANAYTGIDSGAGVNTDRDAGDDDGEGDPALSIKATNLSILADGTAMAKAEVATQSNVSLASAVVNVLTATVDAQQKAQLNDAHVEATSVTVNSKFNDGTNEGAEAVLGSATTGSISASVYSGTVNVVAAKVGSSDRILSEASAANAHIKAATVSVQNDAKSYAKAHTQAASASIGLVNVGAVHVDADADGLFAATVRDGSVIEADTVNVRSNVTATSEAVAEQPKASFTFAAGTVNMANADTGMVNEASVSDSDIIATGKFTGSDESIRVYADATATAFATIKAPTVAVSGGNLLISDVDASVSAQQTASISGGSVNAAHQTEVIAWLNDNGSQGAEAKLEATYVGISGANINTNTADATVTSVNDAFVSGTDFGSENDPSGQLRILSDAISYSKAHYTSSAFQANGANLGVMVMNAKAAGSYDAYLDSSDAEIYVDSIDIDVDLGSESIAKSSQPAGGFSAEAVSGQVNRAVASSTTSASGGIRGSGIIVSGDIDILVDGSNSFANADVDGKEVSISGVSVGVNLAESNLDMSQSAYIEGEGTISSSGDVSVVSRMNDGSASTELGSNGGADVSLIAGTAHWADANAKMENDSHISGNVTIDMAGVVSVLAQTNGTSVTAKSESNDTAASLAALNVIHTHAKIEGMSTTAAIGDGAVIRADSVSVKALATGTEMISKPEVPSNAFSGVDGKDVQAHSTVRSNSTKAGIGSGVDIETTGDVVIYAETDTKMLSETNKNTSVSLVGVGRYQFFNNVDSQTAEAYLDGKVLAGGDLNIEAKNKVEGDSKVNNSSVGAVTSGETKISMTVNQKSTVSVGAGADAEAKGDVTLKANAYVDLHGIVNTKDVGLGEDSTARIDLTWNREQLITVGDNARLVSRYGDLSILSGDSSVYVNYKFTGHLVII